MLAEILYRHTRYFILFLIVMVAVGTASFSSIARQEDPTITNLVATVATFSPGASPERVEALVTRPIEDELRRISEIDELYSTSSTGISFITIKLLETLSSQDIERSWSEIRDALDETATQFPQGVSAPVLDDDRLSAYAIIVALSSTDYNDVPLSLLHRIAQQFADQARNIPGTRLVDLYGEPSEEVRVEIDENALTARGLSLDKVAHALQAADPRVSSGRVTGSGTDMLIEIAGDFDSMARIRNVIVDSSASGSTTRISDIADVFKTHSTPPSSMALTNGKPGILIAVAMDDGLQVDKWSKSFVRSLDEFRSQAPNGISLEISYQQSVYTSARMVGVSKNLAAGVVLVLLVLLVTMGWRAALVVAVILPLCGLMSLTILNLLGMAIHQMSVTGLIVALGLLVDGSIVMTDEIRKRLKRGNTPLESITRSVHRLRVPLLASTVTTILTFLPLAILPGPAGDFMGSIAISVIVMLGSSLMLAMIFTPVLAAWLLPGGLIVEDKWWLNGIDGGWAGKKLSGSLDWSLHNPVAAIALALILPVTGFLAFGTLTAQFFPGTDRDQLFVQVKLSEGRSIYDTEDLVKRLDLKLRQEPLIRRVDWTIGESAPAFYYNMFRFNDGIPTWAEALVLTTDENLTDDLIRRLQREVDAEFPEARVVVRGIDQGPPVQAPLEIELYGPSLDTLKELGEQFRLRMESIPDVTHTNVSLTGGAPKLVFTLDEAKLRLAKLDLAVAAAALDASLRGRTGGEVLEGTERLPVRVRLGEEKWADSDQIASIRVPAPNALGGEPQKLTAIPLSALGKPRLLPSRSPISRFNGERTNIIQGYLVRGVLPEEALKFLRADLAANPIALPVSYRLKYGGNSDERSSVVEKLMAPLGIIISALLATIILTFNSWRLTGITLLVFICSFGLSLLCLAIFRYPFGLQALIGVIGSVGVSINAAIIIMTALKIDDRASQGDLYAIRSVVMDSSRHIVSTTVTTFGGFLPLILEGSQFWPPFAMAIAGGVLLSTIVSFFLVPPLFVLAGEWQPGEATSTEKLVGEI